MTDRAWVNDDRGEPVVQWDAWLTVPEASRHFGIPQSQVLRFILAHRVEAQTAWTPDGSIWMVWVPTTATRETWGTDDQDADDDIGAAAGYAAIACGVIGISLLVAAVLWLPEIAKWLGVLP